ncbi:putative type I restriction enzyme EcoR124II R protein [Neisseria gonorrhoeae]|uniref:Putative type I restriction enzyme EcoR124II R protein n=1 Tax=Neisseria gonorrhoeae TaxID=485 RepID=A0A378VYN0_NEIGO|nr:putative type I restriction enzyme EcoR124II R protein [Neisseria gonorrhoeae]
MKIICRFITGRLYLFSTNATARIRRSAKNLKRNLKILPVRLYRHADFPENALGAETTAGVFGRELHSYVITDAIRDEKY